MIVPARVTKEVADDFVARLHRHHAPDQGCRFVVGAWDMARDKLCGVGVVGRPRARAIDQRAVVEVTRNCTDGTFNACSFIYARAAHVAQSLGFRAIITYTLADEGGASLRALSWWGESLEGDCRWLCMLNADCFEPQLPTVDSSQLELIGDIQAVTTMPQRRSM